MGACGSGPRIRTGRILINSQAHPPRTVDRNKLVEDRGVEPRAGCLQGIPVPRYVPRIGADPLNRTASFASSERRAHQLHKVGELERVMRIELTTSTLARLRSAAELHPHFGGQGMDSNPRRREPRCLQHRSFGRLDTCPKLVAGGGLAPPTSWV